MDWQALELTLLLGIWTTAVLLPFGVWLGRVLAWQDFPGKAVVEAAAALPLVLPPTVLGYYLLVALGGASPIGQLYKQVFGHLPVFSFEGLVIASVIFNIPFTVQPMQRAFEAIPREVREAAAVSGMSPWRSLLRIELPLAWPGILTALVLTFTHTVGEFGVVLMVGGSIPGETKTIAIAIYDRVQAFDLAAAGQMALFLLLLSLATIAVANAYARRAPRH